MQTEISLKDTCVCTLTLTPLSSVCPWVWVSFVWPPPLLRFLSCSHISFVSPPDTPLDAPECQTGQTDRLHVPTCGCVCVPVIIVYVMCTAADLDPLLPPSLALSQPLPLSMCLCHGSSGTLRAQRSGWSAWWSRWLAVWHGLTRHGGSQIRGGWFMCYSNYSGAHISEHDLSVIDRHVIVKIFDTYWIVWNGNVTSSDWTGENFAVNIQMDTRINKKIVQ